MLEVLASFGVDAPQELTLALLNRCHNEVMIRGASDDDCDGGREAVSMSGMDLHYDNFG